MKIKSFILLAVIASLSTTSHARKLTDIQKQEIGDLNLLGNSGFENGQASYSNTGSGTFSIVTSGANLGFGSASGSWDAAAASDALTSRQVSIPNGISGFCNLSFNYKGGDANITAEAIDGSSNVLASKVLDVRSEYFEEDLSFVCPSSGTIAFRLTASADAAIIYLDKIFMGSRGLGRSAVLINPTVYQKQQQIATVGAINNAQQAISASDFSGGTASFYHMEGDSLDDSANSFDLTNNGSIPFASEGFFDRNDIASLNGTNQYFSSTNSHFDPANVSFGFGGWFKTSWQTQITGASSMSLIGKYNSGGFLIQADTNQDDINWYTTGAGVSLQTAHNFKDNEWHHLAMTYNPTGTLWKMYQDGRLVGTHTALNGALGGQFHIGALNTGSADFFKGEVQDPFFVNGNTPTDAEINAIYSRRFDTSAFNKQIEAGNTLSLSSFPSRIPATDIAYWNLAADSNDDSGNGINLTQNGTVTFGDLDLFGVVGASSFNEDGTTTDFLSSTDLFFNGERGAVTYGGWFKSPDWEEGNQINLIGQIKTNEFVARIFIQDGIFISASSDGTSLDQPKTSKDILIPGKWHHFVHSVHRDGKHYLYVDGQLVLESDMGGTLNQAASTEFNIATTQNLSTADVLEGQALDNFWIRGHALTGDEVRNIYSSKINHQQAVEPKDQQWFANFFKGDNSTISNQLENDWQLDKQLNDLIINTGLDAADTIQIKMQNQAASVTHIPMKTYTSGILSAAPSFPIAHGLPCRPQDFYTLYEGATTAGDWSKRYDLLDVDENQILGDLGPLGTIDATHRIQIVASCAPVGVAVDFVNDAELLITKDQSKGDLTVNAGESFYRANVEIQSGHTYTINGTWNSVGAISGSGTLTGTGTIKNLDMGQNGDIATFDDVVINGSLTHNGPLLGRVIAVYHMNDITSNPSVANSVDEIIDYNQRVIDTHEAVTTGATWKFTAPRSGYYMVNARVGFNSTADFQETSGEVISIKVFVNGIRVDENFHIVTSQSALVQAYERVNKIFELSEGDELDIRCLQNSGISLNLKNTPGRLEVSINEL